MVMLKENELNRLTSGELLSNDRLGFGSGRVQVCERLDEGSKRQLEDDGREFEGGGYRIAFLKTGKVLRAARSLNSLWSEIACYLVDLGVKKILVVD